MRSALVHLNDPSHLQTHPLARLMDGAALEGARGMGGVGSLLAQSLLEIIESLCPPASISTRSPAWRPYLLLQDRYMEGIPRPIIEKKLAISKTEYYRVHQAATRAVAALLEERWRGEELPVLR